MNAVGKDQGPVSMLFELSRDDNPRLYDDLMRFNKGTKRINRLRFLAHEGLLAQNWMLIPAAAPPAVAQSAGEGTGELNLGEPSLTNQSFARPLAE
jgi:hypothetical protein